MNLLKENKVNIPVVYGGTILKEDRKKLLSLGIKETFSPGTMTKDITETFDRLVPKESVH